MHFFKSSEVNAFALPGNHIVVFSGLIGYAESAEEVGLSMLFVFVGGNEGQEILRQVLHTMSSTSFDREYETEADMFAVETMAKANINPEPVVKTPWKTIEEKVDDL